jgi:hypothetical protein
VRTPEPPRRPRRTGRRRTADAVVRPLPSSDHTAVLQVPEHPNAR